MILYTDRLIMRPFEESDAENVYLYARDERVGPVAGWPVHTSVENSREVIRNVLMAPETYAVCLKEDNRAIGAISIMFGDKSNLDISSGEGEIGYWLGAPFWGKGLMPEAVNEIIRHGFSDLKLDILWCGYFDGNNKSKRCQEKCGFVYSHTKKDIQWELMNDIRTEHVTRLTRNEWLDSFSFRRLEECEIGKSHELAWKVFSEYEAPYYSNEGIEEFRSCLTDNSYLSGISYYGAFDKGILIGMIGIRTECSHICFMFVDGLYHRLGVGSRLFELMMRDFSGKMITVNSSPYGIPFYTKCGFIPSDIEQTINGIRFTPMSLRASNNKQHIVKLSECQNMKDKAADWFADKWSVPVEAYLESIEDSFDSIVPSWYLYLDDDRIVAGMGVIENDFHERRDLSPNVCAVYTEPSYRNHGIAGLMLNYVCHDMSEHGISTLYLLTDLEGFYERYGWKFLCMVQGLGEDYLSRMYIHECDDFNEA